MFSIFAKNQSGMVTVAWPDTCRVPPGTQLIPTPYPNATLIVAEAGAKTKVHIVKKGRVEDERAEPRLTGARTFIIGPSGGVTGKTEPCTSPSMAREMTLESLGRGAAATVISIGEGNRSADAFRVTARSTRAVDVVINPPELVAAIRELKPPLLALNSAAIVAVSVEAFRFAHQLWKAEAMFKGITIMGALATAGAGCLSGPDLYDKFVSAPVLTTLTGDDKKVAHAVGKGISHNFTSWQQHVTVPGLAWYPAFAAWPGAVAPPMPNVPMPLIACSSAASSEIVEITRLKNSMAAEVDDSIKQAYEPEEYESVFAEVAIEVAVFLLQWLAFQAVRNVLGHGPVPSYVPPYHPYGPVIGGSTLHGGGHLL